VAELRVTFIGAGTFPDDPVGEEDALTVEYIGTTNPATIKATLLVAAISNATNTARLGRGAASLPLALSFSVILRDYCIRKHQFERQAKANNVLSSIDKKPSRRRDCSRFAIRYLDAMSLDVSTSVSKLSSRDMSKG
jgi:hypothetical protein